MTTGTIDSTLPNRLSMNVTVGKQTQSSTFGEKVNYGLNAAGGALVSGASLLGGVIPGVGVISAAVNSAAQFSGLPGGAASSAGYAATGVVTVGSGGMSTTVGGNGTSAVVAGSGTGNVNYQAGASSNQTGAMNNEISTMAAENSKLLQTQIAMQRENQVFTSVSNVLKTKHDTVKNTISNVR
jgi:hypothetical protein